MQASRTVFTVLVVGVVLLALAVGAGGVWLVVGAPHRLAQPIADSLPPEWDAALGDLALEKNGFYQRRCNGAGGEAALAALLALLGDGPDAPLEAVVWITPRRPVAAYAGPGNRVLLTDGLLQRIGDPDQFAGLLAHLLGHSQARHPSAWMVRELGLDGVVSYLVDDAATLRAALEGKAEVARFIPYTAAEDEAAEAWAAERLAAAGIAPGGMRRLWEGLNRTKRRENADIVASLGQHPMPEMPAPAPPADARPALTETQWRQLKAICR